MSFERIDGGIDISASIDHVIPLRLGGDLSAMDNLRLAHRICNSARDQWNPTAEQLRSFLRKKWPRELGEAVGSERERCLNV